MRCIYILYDIVPLIFKAIIPHIIAMCGIITLYFCFIDTPNFLYSSFCSSALYLNTEYSTNAPSVRQTTNIVITVPISNTTPLPSPKRSAVSNNNPPKLYNACTNAQQKIFFVFIREKANSPPVNIVYPTCNIEPLKICAMPKTTDEVIYVHHKPFLSLENSPATTANTTPRKIHSSNSPTDKQYSPNKRKSIGSL